MKLKKVVVIGGGTGTVAVLNGIKEFTNLDIKVIVSMTDDGGSQKVIRDEFGLLPFSDVRKSIIALAKEGNGLFRELFTYRFDKGNGLSGHTLGNLIMMALSDITGSEEKSIDAACGLFNVLGQIIPVTYDNVRLRARYDDGSEVTGEHIIDGQEDVVRRKLEKLTTEPIAKPNPKAVKALREADFIVIGPGDLYTSTLANVVVDDLANEISNSKAKKVLVTNLMTNESQTWWMRASDLVKEVEKYCKCRMDVIIQNNRAIPTEILRKYEESSEFPFEDDLDKINQGRVIIRADVIGDEEIKRTSGDVLRRSLVRHDSKKLGGVLNKVFEDIA